MAPRSGSVEQNGPVVAEQIGGQIFIDTWGLVAPANPHLAAEYAEKAASVSHGGNGVYGGMFVAACISTAFTEKNIEDVIASGLSVIPQNCEYARMTREIIGFHRQHPESWRDCFQFVKTEFWTNKYPSFCHIIPNSAIMVLSMLYGKGDFSKTINICNMCGFDTDCNVGNVGTIMGVLVGLEGIDYEKWRKPINDFLACSSVIGSLNIIDIPWCIMYIAKLAYKIAEEEIPSAWKDLVEAKGQRFHFEFPGSTHGFRVSTDSEESLKYVLSNTLEYSHTGIGALKVAAHPLTAAATLRIFHKTYYRPKDFHDSRYDPSFSPVLYPGQTIKASVRVSEDTGFEVFACLYVKEGNSGQFLESEKVSLTAGAWCSMEFTIPYLEGACLEEAGVGLVQKDARNPAVVVYLDDVSFSGLPDYRLDFDKERMEAWNKGHNEVSQFTFLKGIWGLEGDELSGSCSDYGEAYTGSYDWENYSIEAGIIPKLGDHHNILVRVQGAIRSYAIGLAPENKLVLYKNDNGYTALVETPFVWEHEKEYILKVTVRGGEIKVEYNDKTLINFHDLNNAYLRGQVGLGVMKGSHCHYSYIKVKGI